MGHWAPVLDHVMSISGRVPVTRTTIVRLRAMVILISTLKIAIGEAAISIDCMILMVTTVMNNILNVVGLQLHGIATMMNVHRLELMTMMAEDLMTLMLSEVAKMLPGEAEVTVTSAVRKVPMDIPDAAGLPGALLYLNRPRRMTRSMVSCRAKVSQTRAMRIRTIMIHIMTSPRKRPARTPCGIEV